MATIKNKYFHPKNKHNQAYDFDFLISKNINLKDYVIQKYGKLTIDFSNPFAVKELNCSLLFAYYGIAYWEFPDENLCPPIPGRIDYLHYLSDKLNEENANSEVKVLDIGTGASLIYPILGVSEFGWNFVATDVDEKSLDVASKIIEHNQFKNAIKLRHQKDKTHILERIIGEEDRFTFTMCNPPFYKTISEANQANSRKNNNLKINSERNFSGNWNELCYQGGEKAFLHTYLYESSKFPNASKWFTSLVSKKENVKSLQESAKKLNVSEFQVISMQQGNKITRIACWNF